MNAVEFKEEAWVYLKDPERSFGSFAPPYLVRVGLPYYYGKSCDFFSKINFNRKFLLSQWLNVASQMAQWVKNLPAMQETQETWVQSLVWEDPLKEEMATHSSILAWRIPRTEELGGLQSMGLQRVGYN